MGEAQKGQFLVPVDVVLIVPPAFREAELSVPPLGAVSLATYLNMKGHRTIIVDLDLKRRMSEVLGLTTHTFETLKRKSPEELFRILGGEDLPDPYHAIIDRYTGEIPSSDGQIYGFSVHTIYHFLPALLIAKWIKGQTRGSTIVMGGPVITSFGYHVMERFPFIDFMIRGYSEGIFERLCTAIKNKENPATVGGVVGHGAAYRQPRPEEVVPLEKVPMPDFSLLPLEGYKANIRGDRALVLPYLISKGCPNLCAFCTDPTMNPPQYKSRRKVVAELQKLSEAASCSFYVFADSTLNKSRDRLQQLCHSLIESGLEIRWGAYCRLDNLDEETIRLMKQAGCTYLFFGIESASRHILHSIGKDVSIDHVERNLRLVSQAGIRSVLSFVVGFPHETPEDITSTCEFIRRNKGDIDVAFVNIFQLEHDSPFHRSPESFGIKNLRFVQSSHFFHRYNYIFDESEGLMWEKKKRQQQNHLKKVRRTIFEEIVVKNDPLLRLLPFRVYHALVTLKHRSSLIGRLFSLYNRHGGRSPVNSIHSQFDSVLNRELHPLKN